jgi:DNA topoisomerase-6 subunit B
MVASRSRLQKMIAREKIIERSAAEFFEANKAIAGFDNPTRSTYTSVRELVENALDAAEKGGFLPDIQIKIELMSKEEIGELMGIKDYNFEEDSVEFIRLSVRDNGIGIRHGDIPKLFGRVLTGSNYGERQSRGRFGLGAKMVLIYSQSTIRVPFEVKSRVAISKSKANEYTSHYKLFIDIVKNAPEVVEEKKYTGRSKNQLKGHGTEVSVCFAGTWSRSKRYINEYIEEMAVITPYASFAVITPDSPVEPIIHKRTVDKIPDPPIEVPLHPVGTDINQLKSEITRTTQKTMTDFLKTHFQRIGDKTAKEVLKTAKITPTKNPKKLDEMELRRLIHEGFVKVRFFPPDGKCLSPLGHESLEAGLKDVYQPEFTCSETRSPSSYSGHAFQVEVAIGYGGEHLTPSYKLLRFANRIPLLFGEGNDLIKKTIEDINWSNYKSNLKNDPLIFAVSLVSTKIPFPETSKEYIAEVDEIRKELRLCLQKAGRKLMRFQRILKKREQAARRLKEFEKYAPKVTGIVSQVLSRMDEDEFQFMFSSTQFTNCLKQREGSIFLPKNPIPVEALPMDSIEGVDLERYDIQTLQDMILLDENQLQELIALGLSEEAIDQSEQILTAILELPELAKDELVESVSAKALDEFAKERGIISGMDLYNADDALSNLQGVGQATAKSLRMMGIRNVKDFFLTKNNELKDSYLTIGLVAELKSKCSVNVLPNITKRTINELHKLKIYSVLDFLEFHAKNKKKLIDVYGLSQERVATLIDLIKSNLDLDIDELREAIKEEELEEEIEDQVTKAKPKKPTPPIDLLELDAPVNTLEGVGKVMAEKLNEKGITTVEKFYQAADSRLFRIRGLGQKTISTNRGNTDVLILPGINFEGKRDLNNMGIFTVRQFLDSDDNSLTNARGLGLITVTKLKDVIEKKLLLTPGSTSTSKKKPTKKLPPKPKTPPKKKLEPKKPKEKDEATKDRSIAEFLGTKKPSKVIEKTDVRKPPKDLLKLKTKISKIPGLGKTTEERLEKVGVKVAEDFFKKDIAKIASVKGITEEKIIEIRKSLSVQVLPHITVTVTKELNSMGIYTVRQFQNAKIAKTSAVNGLGVKNVKKVRKLIIKAFKTSAELTGST